MIRRRSCVVCTLVVWTVLACASAQKILPAEPSSHSHEIARMGEGDVFDAVIAVAQAQSLRVTVVDKSSGLARFAGASFTAAELDRYCRVPLVYTDTGQPVTTFAARDRELRGEGEKGIGGTVELQFLVSEQSEDLVRIDLQSTFVVRGPERNVPCASTGEYEKEYFINVDRELLSP